MNEFIAFLNSRGSSSTASGEDTKRYSGSNESKDREMEDTKNIFSRIKAKGSDTKKSKSLKNVSHIDKVQKCKTKNETLASVKSVAGANLTEKVGELSKEDALKAVKQDGKLFFSLPLEFREDRDVVLEVVKENGFMLKNIPKKFQDDKEIVLEAVKSRGLSIKVISNELFYDFDVALAAVKSNGGALRYVAKNFQDDEEIVLSAINHSPKALSFASSRVQSLISHRN